MRRPTIAARRRSPIAFVLAAALALAPAAAAQGRITSPKEQFGFNIGDDYKLANYTQFEQYWRKLDARVGPDEARRDREDAPRGARS